ncbi:MAG: hypothetical protein PW843_24065 [Azospirillaceae bacterium]|nr:hypothetical protein [Azospirillaceae bacterium]
MEAGRGYAPVDGGGWFRPGLAATPAFADVPPKESLLMREADYTCFRATAAGGLVLMPPSPAPLHVGNHVARTQEEWRALWWNTYGGGSNPLPASLPDGHIAVAITMRGSDQAHAHVRTIEDDGTTVRFGVQREERKAPLHVESHTGQAIVEFHSDSGTLETLVIFYPAPAGKPVTFTVLPDLVWTPATERETWAVPPCARH